MSNQPSLLGKRTVTATRSAFKVQDDNVVEGDGDASMQFE